MIHREFKIGDPVKYIGEKRSALAKSKSFGQVVGYVKNTDAYVVEFGSDSFVMPPSSLARHSFNDTAEKERLEIVRISRKWDGEQ